MIYVEAPEILDPRWAWANSITSDDSLFLAGSITGAWNWQREVAQKLGNYYNVFNPRRDNFDTANPAEEKIQITWEHKYLEYCKTVFFYFSHETLAPITLLEYGTFLGRGSESDTEIYVAIHPEYKRKNDVVIQTELRAPRFLPNICFDLDHGVLNLQKHKLNADYAKKKKLEW